MKLKKHMRGGKVYWEILIGEQSVMLTTTQLQTHRVFSLVVERQALKSDDWEAYRQAFQPLTKATDGETWASMIKELLAGVEVGTGT